MRLPFQAEVNGLYWFHLAVGGTGSVLVSWSGAIADPARRALWHDQLRQAANRHERLWREADVQPGFAALAALRGAPAAAGAQGP